MRGPSMVATAAGIAVIAAQLASSSPALAQVPSGSTLSPDLQSYMVNKDLGDERWTINLNLYSTNPNSIINITGNIFRTDEGPASFVTCLERADSTGSLDDAESTFRLSCSGASACTSTAETCAREGWTLIDDDVAVPASFFLPPGGNGEAASASARQLDSFLGRLVARLSAAWTEARRFTVAHGVDLTRPRAAWAQASGRGATFTVDRLNHLVTKDVGGERWSISYSSEPFVAPGGGVASRFLSITGNVYEPDGSPPSFVYCTVNEGSTGTLDDPSSEFDLTCSGTDACTDTAVECAQSEWRLISSDIALQASFFLPPEGLPASPQSDSEILVIGRTSDPPAIVAPEFTSEAGGAAAVRPAGGCPQDAICFVPVLGTCEDVQGVVDFIEGFGCGCVVDPVPPSCIACAGAESGQCGTDCEYEVSDATARGTCLPFAANDEGCICYAIGAGEDLTTQGCGGAVEQPCPGDRCCANDPRGSCLTVGGQVSCPGVCVAADGCDPEVQQCGICQSRPGVPTPSPSPATTPTPAPTAPTPTPAPTQATPTPTQTPQPTQTPRPTCRAEGVECEQGGFPPCCTDDGLDCLQEGKGFICSRGDS